MDKMTKFDWICIAIALAVFAFGIFRVQSGAWTENQTKFFFPAAGTMAGMLLAINRIHANSKGGKK